MQYLPYLSEDDPELMQLILDESDRLDHTLNLIAAENHSPLSVLEVMGSVLNTKTIENSIAEIETNLQLAETLYERQMKLWEQNIGSEVDLLTAKTNRDALKAKLDAANSQLEMAIITSPIDGIVDDIYQKVGEMAGPGIPFARVVNISKLYIYGDVSEAYLMHIKKGDAITIYFPAIDHTIKGRINQKSNIINPQNRTFRIRVNIDNPNGNIKPNLIAEMKIRDYYVPETIVVPSLTVIKDFKGEYLFVAERNNPNYIARKTYVKTGRSNNNSTIVLSGLEPGQLIIIEGFEQVVNETPILRQ